MDEEKQCKYVITIDGRVYEESQYLSLKEIDTKFVQFEDMTDYEGDYEDTLGVNFGDKNFNVELRYYTNKGNGQFIKLPILFMRDLAVLGTDSTNKAFSERMKNRAVILCFIDSIVSEGVVGSKDEIKRVEMIIKNNGDYTYALRVLMEKLDSLDSKRYYLERKKYLTLRDYPKSWISDIGDNGINEGPVRH